LKKQPAIIKYSIFGEFMRKKFNKVTEKAIKQTLSGKKVKKFKSLDDLLKDLETR